MGAIAIAVLPIREEINLEIDDEGPIEQDTQMNNEDEEPERFHPDDNQISVDESGAMAKPAIALWDDEAYE